MGPDWGGLRLQDPRGATCFGWTAVHEAALANDAEAVNTLIAAGADPNAACLDGIRPLHVAALRDSGEAAQALLEGGAETNAHLPYPLGHPGVLALRSDSMSVLTAFRNGKVSLFGPVAECFARVLVAHGHRVTRSQAAMSPHDASGPTYGVDKPMSLPAEVVDRVRPLLFDGLGADATNLIDRVQFKHAPEWFVDEVRLFSGDQAPPPTPTSMLLREVALGGASPDTTGERGSPVLVLAVEAGWSQVVIALLASGANVDAAKTPGYTDTALILSARAGKDDLVSRLLDAGATVDLRGQGSTTALIEAARAGHEAIVRRLLEAGGRRCGLQRRTGAPTT